MMAVRQKWALIVHGGAKQIRAAEEAENLEGLASALASGRAILEGEGTAIDACEAAVRVLESRPVFNAGRGSVVNSRGEIEMSAALMNGRTLEVGAVAALKHVRHPVSVAKALLPEAAILLVGSGAYDFAATARVELCREADLIVERSAETVGYEHDTVGAIALDQAGDLAAATSTGGLRGTAPGRVGDSPLPGCGFYADNDIGAVALSGDGEGIARLALAGRLMTMLKHATPEVAARGVDQMSRIGGDAGAIVMNKEGRIGWAHTSEHFAVGLDASDLGGPQLWLKKSRA